MSFMSLTTNEEAVMAFERSLTGTNDVPGETIKTSSVTSGAVSLEEYKEEEGFYEEGLGTAVFCC